MDSRAIINDLRGEMVVDEEVPPPDDVDGAEPLDQEQQPQDDNDDFTVNSIVGISVVDVDVDMGDVSLEKSGSDLGSSSENNTTPLSDEDLAADSIADDDDVNDMNDISNEESGIELGLKKSYSWWPPKKKNRFYVINTNNGGKGGIRGIVQDKRRRRVVIGASVAAVLLLIIIIVASACGSGQCGGNSSTSVSSVSTEAGGEQYGDDGQDYYDDGNTDDGNTDDAEKPDFTSLRRTVAPDFVPPPQASSPFEALTSNNVIMIDPSMTVAEIQGICDNIYYQQENNEMGTERYSLYFLPGTYGSFEQPLMLKLGYYTEMAGLGASPEDVVVYGKIEVYNRCFDAAAYVEGKFTPTSNDGNCFALNNFWRSLSNLAIQIVSLNQDQCRSRAMFWAISQASSMRRVDVRGGELSLMDYCTMPGYASGGYIADSRASTIFSGSQQQFFTRNSAISGWEAGVWNQVFMGVTGAPQDISFPDPPFTIFDTAPMKREKPYIYVETNPDDGETTFWVRVPSLESETAGVSWSDPAVLTPGRSLAWDTFFVADPSHSAATINAMLAMGKHVIFTPGVYPIDESIVVDSADTVLLGLGHATLTAVGGVTPLRLMNRPGIIVAGITIDASTEMSDALLVVGSHNEDPTGDVTNPITLSDIYFRLGGPHVGKAKVCLRINCNNVLIDHTWVWRADHGVEPFDETRGFLGDNERWTVNVGENGVVVNGDDVVAMGLFVEHFQQHNVIWNGERGRVYFFQNELPYDPPTQQDWMDADGKKGWAAYKVDDSVTDHKLWAGGVYCYNRNNRDIVTANGFEVPQSSGVSLTRVYTRNLSGPGIIQSVINGVGEPVTNSSIGPNYVMQYPS